jgi:8-oxo-dGTP pyrophosphatase MutT (NUDIX family)
MSRMEPLGRNLLSLTDREQVAALPWRKTKSGVEVMLITSRGTGRWVLPKGWIELGDEEPAEAAAREALEEAGVIGEMTKAGLGFYVYDKVTDGTAASFPVRVRVYPLEVRQQLKRFKEAGERVLEWFSGYEAADAVKEADLGKMIRNFTAAMDQRPAK